MSPVALRPDAVLEQVAARVGPAARRDVPLGPYCTYRVGGPAALFVSVGSLDELHAVGAVVAGTSVPVLVLGRGSNLLVADRGFAGLVLHLSEAFAAIGRHGDRLEVGGAAPLPVVARRSASMGLTGFEWAVGVPGSIGGAVRMNAGGHGSDMAASLVACQVYDLAEASLRPWPLTRLELGYRRSSLQPHHLVVSAELALAPGDPERGAERITEIVAWRRAHQPGGQNAGSVFANPPGDSAGRLIEAAGLKGHRLGTAAVSTRHANFIQVEPGGSADDVAALMVLVRQTVWQRLGVALRPENRLVGFPAPVVASLFEASP